MRFHVSWIGGLMVLAMFGVAGKVEAQIPPAERDALIALYNSTDGSNWTNTDGWLGAVGTECDWYGVTCDGGGTTVVQLWLDSNGLNGTLPTELGNLENLTSLGLGYNQLSGSIPAELGNLSSLEDLTLWYNQLTGGIPPDLGNLSNLNQLNLFSNQLTGGIPVELGNLSSLVDLILAGNPLGGSIPPELENLGNLVVLSLYQNQLSGSIPPELGNLANLGNLNLSGNDLTGSIPTELGSPVNLRYLSLGYNQLSGSIPPDLGNLSDLEGLWLDSNELSGSIPPELGNLSNLRRLGLDDNQLTGSIPPDFGSLGNLEELWLDGNQLSGSIPSELGNLTNLVWLRLEYNQLTGSIPPELGNLSNVTSIWLQENQLTGSIPGEIGNLSKLEGLNLTFNHLTGNIPPELGNLSSLRGLCLAGNRLGGSIPPEIGNLGGLELLWLHRNMLSGSIPVELANLTNLKPMYSPDIRYNALYTDDPDLQDFLDANFGLGWESYQTVAPEDLMVTSPTTSSLTLEWSPIEYSYDPGGYELYYSLSSGGSWFLYGRTADKYASSAVIDGLSPGTRYYFKIRTVTDPSSYNQNTVVSEYSSVVSGITTSTAALSVNDVEVLEGDTGTVSLEFEITLSGSSSDDVWVDWATADGTATAGTDYVADSGTVHFTPGNSSGSISIEVMCDFSFEENETFSLVLSRPFNAVIDDGEGIATILNDDAYPITVPVAAHVEGVGGTPWRSDLAISNPFGQDLGLQLSYQPDPDTVISRSCALPPYGTLLYEDVVQSVFEAGDGRGPLCVEVRSKSMGAPVVASRIFAVRDFGNLGQGIQAVSVMDTGPYYLPGLHQDDSYRSNVAVAAGPDSAVTATMDLYRGDEGLVASGVQRTIEPGEQDQWSVKNLFKDMSLPGVPMTVKVSLSAPAITYASLADQVSNDAVTYLGKVPRKSWMIPIVAHNPGKEETFWSSTVSIANLGTETATVQLEYLPEKTNNSSGGIIAPDIELDPGETLDLEDPVLQLFGESDQKGVLIVSSDQPVVVVSRTFTDAETGGTTGHGVRTLPLDALEERELVLPGVRMTEGFRTNVGVVTNDRWTTFQFRLRDHEGLQRAEEYITVPPRTVRQWSLDRLFGDEALAVDPTGSVAVDADGEFVAYLVVVDGSSQDPAFMLPAE